jgi:hypothetical protein
MRACPRVRREVYVGEGMGAGTRIEVEYFEHWDDSEIIFPEDVYDNEESDERR